MMKQTSSGFRYMLLTYRLDMLWLPVAFWALFLLLAWMLEGTPSGLPVTVAFLGIALPLIGGILGAYAVLEDPALELHFATPRPAWRMLVERLGVILALLGLCALAYQAGLAVLGIRLDPLGNLATRQLAWLVPTLALAALGAALAFAGRQPVAGAAAAGMIWIVQLLLRGWFLQSAWGQYLLLMMGSNYPDHPGLRGNQISLAAFSALLLFAAWSLLRRQERYL